jgi:hypothetical protein
VNRRAFLGLAAQAAGAALVAGSLPAVLSKPRYPHVLTPEYIQCIQDMHAQRKHCGSWTAEEHLQWVADTLGDLSGPDRDRLIERCGLSMPLAIRIVRGDAR